ncbi:MAG: cob(I)yrinic acid a,c-diamide adenosyltransferase [Pseudomonadota bacterium]|nr:cob(I)yrinic acid a,c-diamide adenosyltransferase [Pseudomonadota bacterium]|tara:strand:+ start:2874 stop:3473 length:600 start_codon:yes stop_codon:yes gene_type:complete
MVKLTKIYTRTGDKGETSLGDGTRTSKDHIRVDTYGTIDEANSIIGIARTKTKKAELILLDNILATIQNELFDLGAEISIPNSKENDSFIQNTKITENQITRIENEIDQLNINLEDLDSFILPGGTAISSYLHLARTVLRKAERLMVNLNSQENINVSETALKYINRLSDLMFVAARYANQVDIGGTGDVLWKPGQTRN